MKIPLILLLAPLVFVSIPLQAENSASGRKLWKAADVLLEKSESTQRVRNKYCQTRRFRPCICWPNVSRNVRYRPAVSECGGNAAVFLQAGYLNVYNVVVRDRENRDRWPIKGINGCTYFERQTLGLNKCSAFKTQRKLSVSNGAKIASVHCLGASGYSSLFKNVVRITVALSDSPGTIADPTKRFCLRSPSMRLN